MSCQCSCHDCVCTVHNTEYWHSELGFFQTDCSQGFYFSELQVDVGCTGGVNNDSHFQLWCFVLLLFCYLPIWTVVEDVPQQRPGLSSYLGATHVQLPFHVTHKPSVDYISQICHTSNHSVDDWCVDMLGPQWFGPVRYMDCHCLTHQFYTGSPLVGSGLQHCSHSVSMHPLWRGGYMVRFQKYLLSCFMMGTLIDLFSTVYFCM